MKFKDMIETVSGGRASQEVKKALANHLDKLRFQYGMNYRDKLELAKRQAPETIQNKGDWEAVLQELSD